MEAVKLSVVIPCFNEERTLGEIAAMTRGYAAIIPDAPLLAGLLSKRKPARIARPLPFDALLASRNALDFEGPLTAKSVGEFVASQVFARFETGIDALSCVPSLRRQ